MVTCATNAALHAANVTSRAAMHRSTRALPYDNAGVSQAGPDRACMTMIHFAGVAPIALGLDKI
jgi:hypothetical protein